MDKYVYIRIDVYEHMSSVHMVERGVRFFLCGVAG